MDVSRGIKTKMSVVNTRDAVNTPPVLAKQTANNSQHTLAKEKKMN